VVGKIRNKVGLGGSCHWCTEAIFQALKGVTKVQQGWISPKADKIDEIPFLSEAVLVHFDPKLISLQDLINVHLHTHQCTSSHSMRAKYRSAIYTFSYAQSDKAKEGLENAQHDFDAPIITQVIAFGEFKENEERYLNSYRNNPEKPFCKRYIHPKLLDIQKRYSKLVLGDF